MCFGFSDRHHLVPLSVRELELEDMERSRVYPLSVSRGLCLLPDDTRMLRVTDSSRSPLHRWLRDLDVEESCKSLATMQKPERMPTASKAYYAVQPCELVSISSSPSCSATVETASRLDHSSVGCCRASIERAHRADCIRLAWRLSMLKADPARFNVKVEGHSNPSDLARLQAFRHPF